MKKLFIFIFFITFNFIYSSSTSALETNTHNTINSYIAINTANGFSLDSYLITQLGFTKGIYEELTSDKTRQAWAWVQFGGEYEDNPPEWYSIAYLRSVNHFHNPITKQGYDGLWWLLWGGFGYLNGVSSIQWAFASDINQSPGGNYSWKDTRQNFYAALTGKDFQGTTVAFTKEERDKYFADTLRGLGQLMHLVEDLSVPEHTRNDGHAPCWLSYSYECWVEESITSRDDLSQYLLTYTPIFFDSSAVGNTNPLVSVPVANLFDTNTYTPFGNPEKNPDVTIDVVTSQNNAQISKIGLSEYTNANFLSPDTMFASGFPYPNWNSVVQNPDPDPDTNRRYLIKLGKDETAAGGRAGNGEHINHFAVDRWGSNLLPSSIRDTGINLRMDRQVYADYAAKLIPRAVGYASSLLSYFFRGQIDMIPDDTKVPAM